MYCYFPGKYKVFCVKCSFSIACLKMLAFRQDVNWAVKNFNQEEPQAKISFPAICKIDLPPILRNHNYKTIEKQIVSYQYNLQFIFLLILICIVTLRNDLNSNNRRNNACTVFCIVTFLVIRNTLIINSCAQFNNLLNMECAVYFSVCILYIFALRVKILPSKFQLNM